MTEISNDIIETQILPKIPIHFLPNFKSVCKSFNSLISNPDFVTGRLIILNVTGEGFHVFDFDSLESAPFFLPFPSTLPWFEFRCCLRQDIHVFGSCNGLLCFGLDWTKLLLLNPLTGMFFNIPALELSDPMFANHNIGFGFDDLSDDYKIVHIVSTSKSFKVRVYSLKAKSWKVTESSLTPSQSPSLEILGDGALIDNHLLHWIFTYDDHKMEFLENSRIGRISRIGCFDLRTDEWVENVGLPGEYDQSLGCHNMCDTLGVFDGCLCLLTPATLESWLSNVDMWVLKEYGVEDTWVKVLGASDWRVTLTLRMCPLCLGHGSQHEILMARGRRHPSEERAELIWYNPTDKRSRLSEVHELHDFPQRFRDVFTCTKSLVSLPGGSPIPKENKHPSLFTLRP